jgi:hypothetical protein
VPSFDVANRSLGYGPSAERQKAFELLQALGDDIQRLQEVIGQDRLPAAGDVRSLGSDSRFVRAYRHESRDRQVGAYTYFLLAPTPERARELTQALFILFDQGITEPIQEQIKKLKEVEGRILQDYREKLAAAQRELDELSQTKNPEVLEPQAINDLKTQRRLLEVDLAGVKARIDACETILNRGGLTNARRDQVENVKIAAEIELAGLAARQKTLNAIIDEAEKSRDFSARLRQKQMEVTNLQRRLRDAEQRLAAHVETIKQFVPFRPVDDKVVIRPIKWEAKPADK